MRGCGRWCLSAHMGSRRNSFRFFRRGGCQVPDLGYRSEPTHLGNLEEGQMSGTDKMKNKAEELTGKGKEALGDATDNRDLQAEGKKDQAAGGLKQAGEKVKDAFK